MMRDHDLIRRNTMTTSTFYVDGIQYTFRMISRNIRYLDDISDQTMSRYELSITFEIDGMFRVLAFYYGSMPAGLFNHPPPDRFDPDSMKCEINRFKNFSVDELEHVLMMLFLTYDQNNLSMEMI